VIGNQTGAFNSLVLVLRKVVDKFLTNVSALHEIPALSNDPQTHDNAKIGRRVHALRGTTRAEDQTSFLLRRARCLPQLLANPHHPPMANPDAEAELQYSGGF